MTPTSTFVSVYQDALAPGWSDWSWTTHNLANASPVSAGTASISVIFSPWAGLNLTNPGVAVAGLDFVDLKVNGGATSGAKILARLGLGGGNYGPSVALGPYCEGGSIPASSFVRCQIPLGALGATAVTPVTAVILQEGSGRSLPAMYFDEVGFSAAAKGDITPPAVSLTAPPAVSLSGIVQVTATATDDVGVVRGEIYLDGALVAPVLSWSWDTTVSSDGAHTLEARAYDAAGNVGSSGMASRTVHNSAATRDFAVSITPGQSVVQGGVATYMIATATTLGAPQPLALAVSGYLPLGVTASLSRTSVVAGETALLTVSTSLSAPPYAWSFGVAASGVYTTKYAGTTLEVMDQTPPVVSIGSPIFGGPLSSTVTFTLEATDNSPAPSRVVSLQLLLDGVAIAGSADWFLIFPLDTTALTDGSHTLSASAIDLSGNVGTGTMEVFVQNSSATRDFAVSMSPPSVSLGQGGSTAVALMTSQKIGAREQLQLAISAPPGISVTGPTSITAGNDATLVIAAQTGAQSGTVDVAASGVYATHTAHLAVTVQGQAPGVALSPTGGSVSGTVALSATAEDHSGAGMARVELLIDGQVIASATGAAATTAWDSTGVTDAAHVFAARATDATGTAQTAATTLLVQNSSATRDFSAAFESSTVDAPDGQRAFLTLNTTQLRGAPEPLQISVLGLPAWMPVTVWPSPLVAGNPATVSFDVSAYQQPGTLPIVALVTGVYSSHAANATLHVVDTIPPQIYATSPPDGAVLAGIVTTSFSPWDNIGIQTASITLDGTELKSTDFDSRTLSNGPHVLTFTATDAAGNQSVTESHVEVLNAPRSHDLVLNGGFERAALYGWQTAGSKQPEQSGSAYDGSYALGLGTRSGSGTSIASQFLWLPDGATSAPLVFWYRGEVAPGTTGATDWQEAAVYDRGGALLVPIFHGQISGSWNQATADLSGLAGKVVELRFSTQGATGTSLWVDGVSLVAAPDGVGSEAPCRTGGNVLFLDGTPGDYIHPGMETITGGTWRAFTMTWPDASPREVEISTTAASYWFVDIALRPLLAGSVGEGATRAAFTEYGPGLDVYGAGSGCGQISGRFQVPEAVFDASGNVVRFTATFEQSCENRLPVLRGCVHYEVPTP